MKVAKEIKRKTRQERCALREEKADIREKINTIMREKLISREPEEVIFYRREKESMYLAELGSYYRFDRGDPLFFEFIEDQIKALKKIL